MVSKKMCAWLDSHNMITLFLKDGINFNEMVKTQIKVTDSQGKELKISKILSVPVNLKESKVAEVFLEQPITEISSLYTISYNQNTTFVIPRKVLDGDEYFYKGEDLGFSYKSSGTLFKLWAPTALSVTVKLYDYYNSDKENFIKKQPLLKGDKGVWSAFVQEDLKGKYYLYEITQYYNGKIKTLLVQDPYSTGSAVNSSKSLVFDMADVNSNVPAWSEDKYIALKSDVDAIIYELHVRDYSIDPSSGVEPSTSGRYLGLIQHNTFNDQKMSTTLDNLLELGVTHVHLLPTSDYGSGDEAENNICYTWYNWGYDPVLYNNVEGSYSSNPNALTRYIEYKTMIQTLHSANLGVIFDAVFNHTYQTGLGKLSVFDKIVPYYYYRVGDDGGYFNGTHCGNELATERPMVRKFIVDSVKYWVKEYHIDGFRFDIMGLIDKETMMDVYNAIKTLNPDAVIYGEGWWNSDAGIARTQCMTQTNVQNTGIAAFNDGIRNCLIGSVFDNKTKGYLQGNNKSSLISRLKEQIQGKITGGDLKKGIIVANPNESINYISCHDNLCFWDKLKASLPDETNEALLKREMLGFGILLTSQGVPFLAEGEEFARTKRGVENSYNCNDPTVNPINWNLKTQNRALFDFCKGLIALRKSHPAFRMTSEKMIAENLRFFRNLPPGVIAYALKNNANGDSWKTIIVGFNNTNTDYPLEVVGTWKIVVQADKAGTEFMNVVQDDLVIPAMGMLVVYGNDPIEKFEY